MADDPGSVPAPRPRRRRRTAGEGSESPPSTPIDAAAPVDPGSVPAPRPRRRRRTAGKGSESPPSTPIDAAAPVDPVVPAPVDDRPFPTFLHTAPDVDARAHEGAAADARRDVDARWIIESAVPNAPLLPSITDHGWLPMLDDRSPDPEICPFLRAVDDTNRLVAPIEAPDPANRCAALRDAVPQSRRQQELVCLASGHVNCPRYLRGAVVIAEAPPPAVRAGRTISPAILGSLLVLVMAASASVAFVMARGGMELAVAAPTASPSPSVTVVAQASATPAPTIAPTPIPSPLATPPPTPVPTPSPSATPSPSPVPTAKPTATPTPRPVAKSDRYAVLRPCPGTPNCWIYRVRSGDNLYSIAHWFGISIDSIYARNPWTRTQGLRAGQELRLPPPTR